MFSRRSLLFGAAAVAAPAIIRPGILMPVKRILMPDGDGLALQSIAHPSNYLGEVAPDLNEQSLLTLMREIYATGRGLTVRPRFIHIP